MATDGPAVRFERVTKRFGQFTAVRDLSFEVPTGTIFGMLGPNGAGKTTSIRMLMNIFAPDEGRVVVLGDTMNEALKARIGYLPEERGLYKKMRVREALRYFGSIKGRPKAWIEPRIEQWVGRFGLSGWIDRRIEELSKGMAQKVQFLSSLLHRPELLVLDEPFAGLDPVNRDFMRDVVLDVRREGTTIVFSTHVMEQAEALCDRIVLIHHGEVRRSGTVEDVRRAEGGDAAFVRIEGAGQSPWTNLPGVVSVTDHGNEAELALRPGTDPNVLLLALVDRGIVRRFEVRALSLHEVFKRTVGETS
jgi:ABC-2 type transport system ATP-binding protein